MSQTHSPWTLVAQVLQRHQIDHVHGLPDDDMQSIAHLMRACVGFHRYATQRAAIAAAAGEALARRRPAVAVVGRGPAVPASVGSLLEAKSSRAPVVVLCSESAHKSLGMRAFQWVDSAALLEPAVDLVRRAGSGEELVRLLDAALCRAATPNTGPTALVIPDGLQPSLMPSLPERTSLDTVLEVAARAPRTLLLVGGGARAVLTADDVERIASGLGAGILVTASGRGAAWESSPRFLGLSGLYLTADAGRVVDQADVILTLGSRLEETALEGMPLEITWLQVQLDPFDVAREIPGAYTVADVGNLVERPVPSGHVDPRWLPSVAAASPASNTTQVDGVVQETKVDRALRMLSDALPEGTRVVHENGLHDIASHLVDRFRLPAGGDAVALSEQTTLGSGVAAALGIALAEESTDRPRVTVCVSGDGAFLTMASDFAALDARSLHLLYVVLDDGGYGWLEMQARGEGLVGHFSGRQRRTEAAVRALGSFDIHIFENSSAAKSVTRAVDSASSGRTAVLIVPCEVADAPTVPVTPVPHQGETR